MSARTRHRSGVEWSVRCGVDPTVATDCTDRSPERVPVAPPHRRAFGLTVPPGLHSRGLPGVGGDTREADQQHPVNVGGGGHGGDQKTGDPILYGLGIRWAGGQRPSRARIQGYSAPRAEPNLWPLEQAVLVPMCYK